MKNFLTKLVLIVLFISSLNLYSNAQTKGDIWLHMLTNGQPIDTYYLGDKLPSSTYIEFEIGQASWTSSQAGIGQSNSDPNSLDWADATWFQDGENNNKKVRRDISNFQFTASGNWYVAGKAIADDGDPWHYANNTDWSNTSTFAPEYYYLVNPLPSPSNQSATAESISSISLNWTSDATYSTVIVVVSTVGFPDDLVQGTAYSQGSGDINSSAGYILYVGSDDYSVTDFIHSGLTENTTYYYKFFTVNNNYYSAAVTDSATTNTAYRTAQNGDWNTASTWLGNAVPPADAECYILHQVTISGTTNNVKSLTIFDDKSLTFNANANLTVNGTLTNHGMLKTDDNSAILVISLLAVEQ